MATIKVKEGIEIYPEGLYYLRVKKIDIQEVKQGERAGDQFLTWEEDILDAGDESYIGETFKHTSPLIISPRSKYFRLLEVLGVPVPKDGEEVEYDTDDFIGQEFVASVGVSKITQGRNAGREKNEFKQLWTPQEFQEFQQKSTRLTGKLNPNQNTQQSQNQVGKLNSNQNQVNTEVVKPSVPAESPAPPVSERKNIIHSSNLSDFPE